MLLKQYKSGREDEVWATLAKRLESSGSLLRDEEAIEVAREACIRLRHNIDVAVDGLIQCEYEFSVPEIRLPPDADIQRRIEKLEHGGGPMPLLLRQIYSSIGFVSLSGGNRRWEVATDANLYPDVPSDDILLSDPLHFSVFDSVEDELVATLEYPDIYPRAFMLGPDALHKSGFSGSSYSVHSGEGVDGLMYGLPGAVTLREYLNDSFSAGGFHGLRGRLIDFPVLGKDLSEIARRCLRI